ncbi:unnamed protein product [Lupinus luteus]|uniref:Uncharacterized protein n=1 Tax=Lupinus luteus TaxID=3873 RepID=A0AAV1WGP1_LUPLU
MCCLFVHSVAGVVEGLLEIFGLRQGWHALFIMVGLIFANTLVRHHILYGQKEQFSDGVGYGWIDGLKAHAAKHVLQNSTRLTVPGGPSVVCSTAKAIEWDTGWSKIP